MSNSTLTLTISLTSRPGATLAFTAGPGTTLRDFQAQLKELSDFFSEPEPQPQPQPEEDEGYW